MTNVNVLTNLVPKNLNLISEHEAPGYGYFAGRLDSGITFLHFVAAKVVDSTQLVLPPSVLPIPVCF